VAAVYYWQNIVDWWNGPAEEGGETNGRRGRGDD
jgi:hypothetical protein